jgi:molecular chaperone GrpE
MAKRSKETSHRTATSTKKESGSPVEDTAKNVVPEHDEAVVLDSEATETDASEIGNLGDLIAEMDRVTEELEATRLRADEMQGRYLRSVADMENFRKRAIKEKEELGKLVTSRLMEELLPVVDNFKLGMQAADQHPDAKVVSEGFRMVLVQFQEVLKNQGVEEVVPTGQTFDPQYHECVAHLPHNEVEENQVIETIRTGYRIKEKLIRPATVVVSSGKPQADAS